MLCIEILEIVMRGEACLPGTSNRIYLIAMYINKHTRLQDCYTSAYYYTHYALKWLHKVITEWHCNVYANSLIC